MSYRTAILIDRYEKSFSDSELQAQVTTTVEYDADLQDGVSDLQEVTSASIGRYPGHKISNAVSTPFSVTIVTAQGEQQSVSMDKQQNLTSTHKRVVNGVTYVRIPYRYGKVIEQNGKKVLIAMSPNDAAQYVWHCNLEEDGVASFDWDDYFESQDGQRLDEVPEFLRGVFIFTENQEQQDPNGGAPETDKVWPALKILTDEDFKAVYISDDSHYYFLVEVDGTDILLGSVGEQEEPPYIYFDGGPGEFLKGVLLQEPIDAAIISNGEEEVVTLDMKFGEDYYRIINTDEVVRVTDDPSSVVTEPDEYTLILANALYGASKSMYAVAQHRGDAYGEMTQTEITDYIRQNSKTIPNGLLRVDYPEAIHEEEFEGIEEVLRNVNETLQENVTPTTWKFVKNTELDENKPPYRIVLLEESKMNAANDIRTISGFFDGPYNDLPSAVTFVNEALDTVTGEVVYPADFTMEEINSFTNAVESNPDITLNGELRIINAE